MIVLIFIISKTLTSVPMTQIRHDKMKVMHKHIMVQSILYILHQRGDQ